MTKQQYIEHGFPERVKRNGRILELGEFTETPGGDTLTVRHGNDLCGIYIDRRRMIAYPLTLKEIRTRCQIVDGDGR